MADRWTTPAFCRTASDGPLIQLAQFAALIDAAGAWHDDPSPANADRLAAIVGAMLTLGIMVPEGEGADGGE